VAWELCQSELFAVTQAPPMVTLTGTRSIVISSRCSDATKATARVVVSGKDDQVGRVVTCRGWVGANDVWSEAEKERLKFALGSGVLHLGYAPRSGSVRVTSRFAQQAHPESTRRPSSNQRGMNASIRYRCFLQSTT
jgi:hypothetical protein